MIEPRKKAFVALACAAASLVVVAVAAATTDPVKLKGTQTVIDEAKGRYAMQGSLIGRWNTTAFKVDYDGPDGEFVGSGKELFTGCQDADKNGACGAGDPTGTLRFSFIYWATFDPKSKTLVRGECVHPVTGGTGGFTKAKGVIHMTDLPSAGGVHTTYTGSLLLAGPSTSSIGPGGGRTLATLSSLRTCGS